MKPSEDPALPRLRNLLAERAIFGLDAAQAAELEQLLASHPEIDASSLERAAAAAELASLNGLREPVPSGLAGALQADAQSFFGHSPDEGIGAIPPMQDPPAPAAPTATMVPAAPATKSSWSQLGWAVAVLAFVVAVAGWLPELRSLTATSLLCERERLMQEAEDLLVAPLAIVGSPEGSPGPRGDVIWSAQAQSGFVRVVGLPPNDPATESYQLWLFDEGHGDAYPIDAGLLDVASSFTPVIARLAPRLAAHQPSLFVVSLEKRGGAALPDKERLVMIAETGLPASD